MNNKTAPETKVVRAETEDDATQTHTVTLRHLGEDAAVDDEELLEDAPRSVLALSWQPLDLGGLYDLVVDASCGAIATFVGTTRDSFAGKRVVELEYEAFKELVFKELQALVETARGKWVQVKHVAVLHRLGVVPVKEASVAIAVSSVHRVESLECARWLIDSLKARVPIWKKEKYDTDEVPVPGDEANAAWKVNAEYDPQSLVASSSSVS